MKSKLSKQQKKYIKACDSKELKKLLKKFFKKENEISTPICFMDLSVSFQDNYNILELKKMQSEAIKNTNENSLTKETLESLTNPDLIEKKKSLEDSIEQHLEKQEILKLSESYKGPMVFCVEITDDNKEVLEKIWKDFHNDRVGYLDNNFLHSNSLHTYCYSSNVSEDNSKPIQVVSTEEFLRYIGKESLIPKQENDKTILEFDLPKKLHKNEKGVLFMDYGDRKSEDFMEQVENMKKYFDVNLIKEFINYTPPDPNKVKKYTEEDMEKCFIESRLTHPIIGFKHTNFSEYLKSIEH